MSIVNRENKAEWAAYEHFVQSHVNGGFMQSLRWAGVKPSWESKAVLTRGADGKPCAAALILIKRIPVLHTCLFYLPHGPVWDFADETAFDLLMEEIHTLAKDCGAYRITCDPYVLEHDQNTISFLKSRGFRFTPDKPELRTIQPRNNYMLFINGRTQEELLASFHSKWRYNIRLATRKGVECRVCGEESLDDFCRLMQETGKRDGFAVRRKEYFARMLRELGQEHCRLFMCYQGETALSGAVTTQYAGKTCYVYGASSNEHRNLMPNYLMQWTMICWAQENGCDVYDFQGIPFYTDENHPNYGVYRFKKGFNGEVVTFAGEFIQTVKPVKALLAGAAISAHQVYARIQRHRLLWKRALREKNQAQEPNPSRKEVRT